MKFWKKWNKGEVKMLLEKARLKLTWGLSGSEDSLKEIKRFLADKDINLLSLSMFEIDGLWSMFSSDNLARFLTTDRGNLEDFLKWLER